MTVRIAAIIPARMASSRFPGKPMYNVAGLPMIEHVRRRALKCKAFSAVVVATCDVEIAQAVEKFGGRVIMTSPTHPGATDRLAEAMQHLDATHIVNVQGDEILIPPSDLDLMAEAVFKESSVPAWNAAAKIESVEELANPAIVKMVTSQSGRVIFCGRDLSKIAVKAPAFEPVCQSIGVMTYRREFLQSFLELKRTPLETAEGIDQMRIVERDQILRVVYFNKAYVSVNEPHEMKLVEKCLAEDSFQQSILKEIL
ncbi:MAG: 3-deoxy-manno-octulosonate cytidylyltransferase [Deltaproteobacteria bacterium]|nr:3-deoxy-manno-octulosonate cytidylyltransferase [Deltaproteobacteria bacterium]